MDNLHEEFEALAQNRGNYEKQVKVRGHHPPPYRTHRTAEPTGLQRVFGFQDRGHKGSPCNMHNKMEELIERN